MRHEKPSLKWLEKAHFRGYGWGGDPAAWMQFGAGHSKYYRLSIDHRSTAYFSAMPSFANPLIDRGILVNQRSYDTRRRMTDAELTLFPLHRITPYFGFTRDTGAGRGVSNFVSDANEYPVLTNLDDRTNLFRGGVRMEFEPFISRWSRAASCSGMGSRLELPTGIRGIWRYRTWGRLSFCRIWSRTIPWREVVYLARVT